jgi:hypothetical protein
MDTSIKIVAGIIVLGLSGSALADIYETKDAEGNTVFTDTPTSNANKVDLPETNVADAVKEMPHSAPEAAAKAKPGTGQTTGQGDVVVTHDNRDERLEQELAEERPHEVLNAEKRHEIGDTDGVRHEVGDTDGVREGVNGKQVEGAHRVARPHVGRPTGSTR